MTQGSRLMTLKERVQRQLRAVNVLTVERAGIKILNLLYTVNINGIQASQLLQKIKSFSGEEGH